MLLPQPTNAFPSRAGSSLNLHLKLSHDKPPRRTTLFRLRELVGTCAREPMPLYMNMGLHVPVLLSDSSLRPLRFQIYGPTSPGKNEPAGILNRKQQEHCRYVCAPGMTFERRTHSNPDVRPGPSAFMLNHSTWAMCSDSGSGKYTDHAHCHETLEARPTIWWARNLMPPKRSNNLPKHSKTGKPRMQCSRNTDMT